KIAPTSGIYTLSLHDALPILEQDVELLKRYRDSVEGHINLFQEKDEAEKVYYHLVEQYLLEYAQKELQYHSSIEQLKQATGESLDRKSTRLNSSHVKISYAVF